MRRLAVTRAKQPGRRLIVDNFAGGGGASTGIELALGRSPDVAINHDPEALAMHEANHPRTRHYATDVFDIDPRVVCRDQPVGLAWFSPDCTHHSKARGGKPIREAGKKSRSLAWVVVRWAQQVRPEVIILENVEEFREWGPVVNGKPCPARKGKTFQKWVRALERRGYQVEHRELRACDYGAPTIRKRLFVIARCDGKRIVWPKPTHGHPESPEVRAGKRQPWRTAAEIIDWSISCPSIFLAPDEARPLGIKRPLKPNTMKRIARGLQRYVLDNPKPYIVYGNHGGDWFRGRSIDEPMATVTASRDAVGIVDPFLTPYYGDKGGAARTADLHDPLPTQPTENRFGIVSPFAVPRYTEAEGQAPRCASLEQPAATVTPTANGASLVSAFIAQHNAGSHNLNTTGRSAATPLSTITTRGTQQQVVAAAIVGCGGRAAQSPPRDVDSPVGTITGKADACLAAAYLNHQRTSNTAGGDGQLDKPVNTITAGGTHVAQVMAFLQTYYGQGDGQELTEPARTVVTKERFGLVTVHGVDYQIVDIGMRMLTPGELYRAQGFPAEYLIDVWSKVRRRKGKDGIWRTLKPGLLTKESQVRMCGNSVCPPLAEALVRANCRDLARTRRKTTRRQLELTGV